MRDTLKSDLCTTGNRLIFGLIRRKYTTRALPKSVPANAKTFSLRANFPKAETNLPQDPPAPNQNLAGSTYVGPREVSRPVPPSGSEPVVPRLDLRPGSPQPTPGGPLLQVQTNKFDQTGVQGLLDPVCQTQEVFQEVRTS